MAGVIEPVGTENVRTNPQTRQKIRVPTKSAGVSATPMNDFARVLKEEERDDFITGCIGSELILISRA
jgi:hypothetical protein